jgi:hypothetical protein
MDGDSARPSGPPLLDSEAVPTLFFVAGALGRVGLDVLAALAGVDVADGGLVPTFFFFQE